MKIVATIFFLVLLLAAVAVFLFCEDAVVDGRWSAAASAAAVELGILTLALASLVLRFGDFEHRLWLFGLAVVLIAVSFESSLAPRPWSVRIAGFVSLAAIAVPPRMWRRFIQTRPALLFDKQEARPVFEMRDVHLAFQIVPSGPAGGIARLGVALQNCATGRRRVSIEFEAENGQQLPSPLKLERVLAGGEAGIAELFVRLPGNFRGRYVLLAEVKISGVLGRRLVLARGQEFENAVRAEETALLALGGVLRWGGGLRLEVDVGPSSLVEAAAPPAAWRSLAG